MIRLNAYCGLGNQMFEYAFARALSEESGDAEICINPYFSFFINLFSPRYANKRTCRLDCFCLNENVKVLSAFKGLPLAFIDFVNFCFISFFSNVNQEKYEKRSKKGNYVVTDPVGWQYFKHSPTFAKCKKIKGTFMSEKFFSNVTDIIKKEFAIKTDPSEENKKMMNEISSCNSVCVHIRRGDFLIPEFSSYNVCNQDYYKKGMDYIAQRITNPVFYIFSNNSEDLKWIRENYNFDYTVKYVDLNNCDYEELRLMSKCKHYVTSNSTFSWWASFLSDNNEKIVIAPDPWQKKKSDKRYKECKFDDIYRDDMVKIGTIS